MNQRVEIPYQVRMDENFQCVYNNKNESFVFVFLVLTDVEESYNHTKVNIEGDNRYYNVCTAFCEKTKFEQLCNNLKLPIKWQTLKVLMRNNQYRNIQFCLFENSYPLMKKRIWGPQNMLSLYPNNVGVHIPRKKSYDKEPKWERIDTSYNDYSNYGSLWSEKGTFFARLFYAMVSRTYKFVPNHNTGYHNNSDNVYLYDPNLYELKKNERYPRMDEVDYVPVRIKEGPDRLHESFCKQFEGFKFEEGASSEFHEWYQSKIKSNLLPVIKKLNFESELNKELSSVILNEMVKIGDKKIEEEEGSICVIT